MYIYIYKSKVDDKQEILFANKKSKIFLGSEIQKIQISVKTQFANSQPKFCINSFFTRTGAMSNTLSCECFPTAYDQ